MLELGLILIETEGLKEDDILGETLAEILELSEIDGLNEIEIDGLTEMLTEGDTDSLSLSDREGDILSDNEALILADSETDGDMLIDKLGL
jgi:hypothetical protein